MIPNNNATRLNREILIRLCELFYADRLEEQVDRLPLQLRPRGGESTRCCVYRDRAVIKYRCMAAMGAAIEDEQDELTPLADYARQAKNRPADATPAQVLTVLDEACAGCVRSRYYVTDACRGCLARPCVLNCPKNAIAIVDGQARIDPDRCVNCGRCVQVCPYHAVVYVPIPCEEACPVGAITRGDNGKQVIDADRCIHCGKCKQACPFAAILEVGRMIDVLRELAGPRKTVALIAPALAGQFNADFGRIVGALKALGFDDVLEVAAGAEQTARAEAAEIEQRLDNGEPWMATSCCPAWTAAARKHLPTLAPALSTTPTPMHFAAETARRLAPESLRIFIGPCLAKRAEAADDPLVDYVLTFEELGAMLVGRGVDVETAETAEPLRPAGPLGRRFARAGGVTEAVAAHLAEPDRLHPRRIDGLDRKTIKTLQRFDQTRKETNFLEVMSCPGGCLGGPATIRQAPTALRRLEELTAPDNADETESRPVKEPLF